MNARPRDAIDMAKAEALDRAIAQMPEAVRRLASRARKRAARYYATYPLKLRFLHPTFYSASPEHIIATVPALLRREYARERPISIELHPNAAHLEGALLLARAARRLGIRTLGE